MHLPGDADTSLLLLATVLADRHDDRTRTKSAVQGG
jgi:hypothetical protein